MSKKVTARLRQSATRRPTFFRQWRKHRTLTLEQAAERSGMTPGNISAMERGTTNYTRPSLEALADAYRCEPWMLLYVDPTSENAMWSIWEEAKPAIREQIIDVAKALVKKTGTDK